jgi:hypothetical protein
VKGWTWADYVGGALIAACVACLIFFLVALVMFGLWMVA